MLIRKDIVTSKKKKVTDTTGVGGATLLDPRYTTPMSRRERKNKVKTKTKIKFQSKLS